MVCITEVDISVSDGLAAMDFSLCTCVILYMRIFYISIVPFIS